MNKRLGVLALVLPLCGCTLLPSVAEVAVSSAVSGVMSGAARLTGVRRHYSHEHPRVKVTDICISWNERVTVPDMVPVLQSELYRLKIASQVYPAGGEPSECEAVLYYAAVREWDRPSFGSGELQSYVSKAQLVLRQRGQVVAMADYDYKELGNAQWGDTESKIGPLVEELIYGNEPIKSR